MPLKSITSLCLVQESRGGSPVAFFFHAFFCLPSVVREKNSVLGIVKLLYLINMWKVILLFSVPLMLYTIVIATHQNVCYNVLTVSFVSCKQDALANIPTSLKVLKHARFEFGYFTPVPH